MTRFRIFLASAFLAVACTSTSAQITEDRKAAGFTSIDVSEGIEVTLSMGDTESVAVTAPEDYIDRVITEVNGGELDIYIKGNNVGNKGRNVKVMVVAKSIKGIESSSGSSLTTTNSVKGEELRVSVSSGAHVNVECEADKVSVGASSGAGATVHGSAIYLSTDASSGSHIAAENLIAENVNANVSSGAHIKVHASKELNADASSGGSVKYSGSPEMIDVEKSSGGSVRKN